MAETALRPWRGMTLLAFALFLGVVLLATALIAGL
jgi:hypothetical protein